MFVWFCFGKQASGPQSGEKVCLCSCGFAFCIFWLSAVSFNASRWDLRILCASLPLSVVMPFPSSKKAKKSSHVTGISTADFQVLPEEFREHHGRHEVWVAEIPFIGMKTFTCDTGTGHLCGLQELLHCNDNVSLHILAAFSCFFPVFARSQVG